MADPILVFGARLAGFSNLVRNVRGQFQSGNQAFAEVNQQSLDFLKKRAEDILDAKVHRYPDDRNKVRLQEIVSSDAAHQVTRDYFRFWIPERAAGIDERVRSFYRAIDEGSNFWPDSGRYVALIWYPGPHKPGGGGSKPDASINTQAAYAEQRGARVLITNPVPAYGFLSIPKREFEQEGKYAALVRDAFKRRGIRASVKG